ncbi:hypothetical protein RJ55_06024 [Drechmeria coniospora]|nr:hypothetical protein RJ55_06024 [Drechmeria coniospora]
MLLATKGPFVQRKNIVFSFNQRDIQTLQCTVFLPIVQQDQGAWPPITAACIDLEELKVLRFDLFVLPRRAFRYESAYSLRHLQIKKITPRNPLQDPYIVAILIAMAQENRDRAVLRKDANLTSYTSQLLVTSSDKDSLYLYKACISAIVLDKLEDPTFAPPEPTSIMVKIIAIPYQQYHSLRDRLTAHLLPEQDLAALQYDLAKIQDTEGQGQGGQELPRPSVLHDAVQSIEAS